MGTGASAEVDAHLRKWEIAVNDLQALCVHHRRLMDGDRVVSPSTSVAGNDGASDHTTGKHEEGADYNNHMMRQPRRASSLVSFGQGMKGGAPEEGGAIVPAPVTPRSGGVSMGVSETNSNNNLTAQGAARTPKHNRQQVLETRKTRNAIFQSYVCPKDVDFENIDNALACSHFGSVAVALSALLGGHKDTDDRKSKVTVEDIFFAAQLPLHLLHTAPPNLSGMNDAIREFIDVDNRFKGRYAVEAVHLDIVPTLGQVELGANDVGDRQCKVLLPEFRKGIMHDIEEEPDAIRIVNYDPFVLEQAMMVEAGANDEERDDETSSVTSFTSVNKYGLHAGLAKYKVNNEGAYAVVVDERHTVQPMVTIAEGAVGDSIFCRLVEVPLSALYKAMMSKQEGHRARGYIRICKKKNANTAAQADSATQHQQLTQQQSAEDVPLLFTPELCSGKVLGTTVDGVSAQAIVSFMSPHISACAWAMHLIMGVRPHTHGHGKGLPVGEIIRALRLPGEVVVNAYMSLDQVYAYFQEYLKLKLLDRNVTLGLYPVLTKISREDAVPTISVFDLESILIEVKNANEDPDCPAHVMVIQYNANVAHNVLNVAYYPQWCVLVGYDDDTQTARLIDANAKRFSQSWSCPLDRLHKAMTGHGYIMVSRPVDSSKPASKDGVAIPAGGSGGDGSSSNAASGGSRTSTPSTTVNAFGVGALRHVASTVQRRLDLIREQHQVPFDINNIPVKLRNVSLPPRPFPVTVLASALTHMGIPTTFNDMLHKLPFDANALLIRSIPLECAKLCLEHMLKSVGADDAIAVSVRHFEKHSTGKQTFPIKAFTELLNTYVVAVDSGEQQSMQSQQLHQTNVVIAVFDATMISIFGNDVPFGSSAIIVGFHEDESTVTLVDANPNIYKRCWSVSIEMLHRAMQNAVGGSTVRTNGVVLLSRQKVDTKLPELHRKFDLSLLPVSNVFHSSPSPQIQGLSLGFAQLGYFFSPEEIFYEAYLKTVSDQRRRGSQAFAWRDVDVSLAILNKKIDARIMTLVSKKFIESRKVTGIVVEHVDDVDPDGLEALLLAAANPATTHVLLLNYNTQAIHGVSNVGNSVALIQSYDPATKTVGFVDAEYTLFGWRWTATLAQVIEAGDLDNPGTSAYGFVKISQRGSSNLSTDSGGTGAAKEGVGFRFGDESRDRENSTDNSHTGEGRKQRGAALFMQQ